MTPRAWRAGGLSLGAARGIARRRLVGCAHGEHHLRSPQVCRSPEGERGAGRTGPRARRCARAERWRTRPTSPSKSDIADLKVLIAETKSDILKWMFASLFAQAAVIVALLKLLP